MKRFFLPTEERFFSPAGYLVLALLVIALLVTVFIEATGGGEVHPDRAANKACVEHGGVASMRVDDGAAYGTCRDGSAYWKEY